MNILIYKLDKRDLKQLELYECMRLVKKNRTIVFKLLSYSNSAQTDACV